MSPHLADSATIDFPNFLKGAVAKRRAEFLAGRYVGGLALKRLESRITHIGRGHQNEPIWPPGYIGSISHCENYAACVVCHDTHYLGIGLDVETTIDPSTSVAIDHNVMNANERGLYAQSSLNQQQLLTLIFSTKEAFFKASFGLIKKYIGFDAISVVSVESEKYALIEINNTLHPALKKGSLYKAEYHIADNGQISVCVTL